MGDQPTFDEIGYWSEIKLDILQEYAAAYSRILAARENPSLYHVYIDAFAGAGVHLAKATQTYILGSPLNALDVRPKFRECHLIDIEAEKVESLKELIGSREDVFIYQGDCNKILLEKIFPRVKYENYRRGLCILDPHGLNLNWSVVVKAGKMKSLDVFLNFPVMDMNRNVLRRNPARVESLQQDRLNAFGVTILGARLPTVRTPLCSRSRKNSQTMLLPKLIGNDLRMLPGSQECLSPCL